MKNARVYNLYPYLLKDFQSWIDKLDDVNFMNFDWIYVNPFHLPGFSGSIYSIKDYYMYNPMLLNVEYKTMMENPEFYKEKGDLLIKKFCLEAEKKGISIMMDLVINHTSVDSELTEKKPDWYEKNEDGTIKNPGALDGDNWIVWGDLAQIDNENSSDKENLWKYWLDYILHYAELGIRGFRCDAAYQVPSALWEYLIKKVKEKYPDSVFLAETLSCAADKIIDIIDSGFDIVMNSFKWWDFKADWFLKDYNQWAGKASSMTFPENHDTERFASEYNGNRVKAVCYYAIEAYFCSSIAITLGFEYGFRKKIEVTTTSPADYEEISYDIVEEIRMINEVKEEFKILQEDNIINIYDFNNNNIFSFLKDGRENKEKIFVIANINTEEGTNVNVPNMFSVLETEDIKDISHGYRMDEIPNNFDYYLKPGEVKLFYGKLN